ncbi:hypothetical protein ABPG74_002645 [Tetrahymena malaccensis]
MKIKMSKNKNISENTLIFCYFQIKFILDKNQIIFQLRKKMIQQHKLSDLNLRRVDFLEPHKNMLILNLKKATNMFKCSIQLIRSFFQRMIIEIIIFIQIGIQASKINYFIIQIQLKYKRLSIKLVKICQNFCQTNQKCSFRLHFSNHLLQKRFSLNNYQNQYPGRVKNKKNRSNNNCFKKEYYKNTLFNYCKQDQELIYFILDINISKQLFFYKY